VLVSATGRRPSPGAEPGVAQGEGTVAAGPTCDLLPATTAAAHMLLGTSDGEGPVTSPAAILCSWCLSSWAP
jgi:hypothetical protein